ncbi:MAG: Panacea domain-containing protein [Hyphomicrobium aestuarii]|nr:Panacea domain-containing protein [Hyphomicrobium aestuarii]
MDDLRKEAPSAWTAPPTVEFDRERLKDVVHYICSQCDEADLGNVKLHKILYFADMLHFNETMKPLTGVSYVKQQFGPTARHLTAVVDELAQEGRLQVTDRQFYGFQKKDYTSLTQPHLGRIGNALPLLDDVIEFVCSRTAKEISELSHNAAWDAAKMGEVIPYFTAIGMEPAELTDDDFAWADAEGKRLRSTIEGRTDEGRVF